MAQGCLKALKYMLFAFNLIFWICGCILMGLGIYLLGMNNFGALLPSLPSLSIANTLIIVGSITMVVAFLGCMGAIKENKCLLLSFFILLLLILLIEVTAAIIIFFYDSQFVTEIPNKQDFKIRKGEMIDTFIEDDMKLGLKKLQRDNVTGIAEAWDTIHAQLKCCGVVNYTDWGNAVPSSCCLEKSGTCDSQNAFQTGCYGLIRNWFESNFLIVGITIICVSIIQVLGMSFAMTMYCQTCNNYKSYDN